MMKIKKKRNATEKELEQSQQIHRHSIYINFSILFIYSHVCSHFSRNESSHRRADELKKKQCNNNNFLFMRNKKPKRGRADKSCRTHKYTHTHHPINAHKECRPMEQTPHRVDDAYSSCKSEVLNQNNIHLSKTDAGSHNQMDVYLMRCHIFFLASVGR